MRAERDLGCSEGLPDRVFAEGLEAGDGVQAENLSENQGWALRASGRCSSTKWQFGDASEREFSAHWWYVKFTSL